MPAALEKIGPDDLSKFYCAVEVFSNRNGESTEANVAQWVETSDGKVHLDKDMNIDQVRKLCRQLRIRLNSNTNKFMCRKSIADQKIFDHELLKRNVHPRTDEARATNTLLLAVNVVFGSAFIHRFKHVNDAKNRVDHETRNLCDHFWRDAALELDLDCNVDEDDEHCPDEKLFIINPTGDKHILKYLEEHKTTNLRDSNHMTADALKKKILLMFKVRRLMKNNMTQSGTHDNNAYNFLDGALNNVAGAKTMSKIGMYYFYMRCEEHDDIDSCFQPFLDSKIRGSTHDTGDTGDSSLTPVGVPSTIKCNKSNDNEIQKKGMDALIEMSVQTTKLVTEITKGNESSLAEQQRNNRLLASIELAKALGDIDLLKKILEEQQQEVVDK